MTQAELRQEIVATAIELDRLGLTQGTSGNVSARFRAGLLVTPSAVPYSRMGPSDVVLVAGGGSHRGGPRARRPSTEWPMLSRIMVARPDIGAIVHAHPPWATALACLRRDIPSFHYMVAVAGGIVIKCSSYATFGTQQLADAAIEALGPRNACLLANHGVVCCAGTPRAALDLAIEVETLAGQYMRALSVGEPTLLDEDEMALVLQKFGDYRT